jgi:hypothetical protein
MGTPTLRQRAAISNGEARSLAHALNEFVSLQQRVRRDLMEKGDGACERGDCGVRKIKGGAAVGPECVCFVITRAQMVDRFLQQPRSHPGTDTFGVSPLPRVPTCEAHKKTRHTARFL